MKSAPARILLIGLLSTSLAAYAGAQTGSANKPFTLRQVMSAPFNSNLIAAPKGDSFAWISNEEGKRNIWVAVRSANGSGYISRQLTAYTADDGQELSDLAWSPDAKSILYVRGGSSDNPEHIAPNPAHLPGGAEQDVWVISLNGGAPREVGPGRSPTFSPGGDLITWFTKGHIWYEKPADIGAKPPDSIHVYGDCDSFTWSPDGTKLAFVSDRGSHSFIGLFTPSTDTLNYLDPGTDHDRDPMWSPDSRHIAFIRIPYVKDEDDDGPLRSGVPWTIRIADVSTGLGHEVWKAIPGPGSVFRGLDDTDNPNQQVFWTADNHLIFPWEHDGWLHLHVIPVQGGPVRLLTPGNFIVESADLSPDRKELVYSSNQGDSERRHIWEVSAASSNPRELTHGTGIEVYPVFAANSHTVALLRSDAHVPIRPAVLTSSGQLHDLAPQSIPASFPASQLIVPQPVVYTSTDGMQIHGDLFLPPNSSKCSPHPAIVFVHGGSQRQMLLGWHYMDYYSYAYSLNQYLANRGYIVLAINYRSGIGYGLDFREALQYGDTGASEFRDVEGAALYLRTRCDVEPSHIGIWGGSWGGFLTAMALAHASNLFAAGVDMSGVHDWNTDNPQNFAISDTAANPNARWRLAWRSSPLASIDTWRSAVLLIQGDADPEVSFLQSVQLAAALRQHHVPLQELIFPDDAHTFLLYRHWYAAYSASASFFDKHLRPQAP